MILKFSKSKMIERLKREGRADQITPEIEAMMDNFDGKEANTYNWANVVYQEPLCWCIGKDGTGTYVNECDCI